MIEVGFWGRAFSTDRGDVNAVALSGPSGLQSRLWDILVVTAPLPAGVGCACRTLLMASHLSGEDLGQVSAERVISLGFSPRDSLTLTAMEEQPVICLQREILTVNGQRVEPQEFPLPAEKHREEAEKLLFETGLQLLLDR